MKRIIISCALLFAVLSAQGQSKWTLRQCVDYAIRNNIDLRQQTLNVKTTEIDLNTSKNSRLPDLNANVKQSFNLDQTLTTDSLNNRTTGNASSTSFSIGSSIPLFTGFKIPNEIKKNKLNLQAAIEGLKKARENVELQVVSLYLDVLFKKEILKTYQEQVALSTLQTDRTKLLVESGKVPTSQYYDIKAQLAKDELNVTMATNDLSLSVLNLSQALNLPTSEKFDIEEPNLANVMSNSLSNVMPPDQVYRMALGAKPQIKEAEYKLESSRKSLNIAKSGYYPKLDLELSYSTGFDHVYKDNFKNPSISKQLENKQVKYIGFRLDIPIFNRFQVRNQVRLAHLDIENQGLILDNVKLVLYKEIQQAYQSAISAQSKYTSTEKARDAAEESFKYAQDRYEVGKSTVFEFSESKTKLLTSKSEQIQAKYDFLFRSKILDFYQGKPIEIN